MKRYHANRGSRGLPLVAGLALMMIAFPAILAAQEGLGRGRVSGDRQGRVRRRRSKGVLVVVEIQGGDVRFEAKTDKKGHFAVAGLGTGIWKFTASKEGYVTAVQTRRGPPAPGERAGGARPEEGDRRSKPSSRTRRGWNPSTGGTPSPRRASTMRRSRSSTSSSSSIPELYQVRLNVASACVKKGDTARAETGVRDRPRKVPARRSGGPEGQRLGHPGPFRIGRAGPEGGEFREGAARISPGPSRSLPRTRPRPTTSARSSSPTRRTTRPSSISRWRPRSRAPGRSRITGSGWSISTRGIIPRPSKT